MINTLILRQPFVLTSRFSLKWKIILNLFWFLSIISIISFLVFYVFQVTSEASARYSIQKYEKKLEQISKENKILEIGMVETNSLNNILAEIGKLNFEKTEKVHYIQVVNNQVVVK